MKTINAWWSVGPLPGNFGDILTPWILEKLNFNVVRVNNRKANNKFLGAGSVAEMALPGDVVWGSGVIHSKNKTEPKAKFLAVRGPITGKKTGCTVYGDPGLLCSKLIPLKMQPIRSIGYVPHYVDRKLAPDPKIEILCETPPIFLRQIIKYEKIVSSSLHGIIAAHSYGIPAAWWKPSNRLHGDDVKFLDYAQSVDIELKPSKKLDTLKFTLPNENKIENIQNDLISVLMNHMEIENYEI